MVVKVEKPAEGRSTLAHSVMRSVGLSDIAIERISVAYKDVKECRTALVIEGATAETGIGAAMGAFTAAGCIVRLEGDLVSSGSAHDAIHQVAELTMPGGIIGGLYAGIRISPDLTFEGAAVGNAAFGILEVLQPDADLVGEAIKWYADFQKKLEAFQKKQEKLRQEELQRRIDHDLFEARTSAGWKTDNPRETSPFSKPGYDIGNDRGPVLA